MSIGLRQLLLFVATVVFVIAIFVDDTNWTTWASIGLACSAGAALVKEMGWDRMLSSAGSTSSA